MAHKKIGKQTFQFSSQPIVDSWASVVGPKEGVGPFGKQFDHVLEDNLAGEKTWEKAEQKMMQYSMELALEKKGLLPKDLDLYLAGDLLNQIISANFTAVFYKFLLGLYETCSTIAQGLCLRGICWMVVCGRIGVSVSSHHVTLKDSFVLQLNWVTSSMTAQWTVTGSGSFVLSKLVPE